MDETSADRGDRIALGLRDFLKGFASLHQARTWREMVKGDPGEWRFLFLSIMDDPDTLAFFNLRGVAVEAGVLRAAAGRGSVTDWELLMIREHPGWWNRIHWMIDDRPAHNPFAVPIEGE